MFDLIAHNPPVVLYEADVARGMRASRMIQDVIMREIGQKNGRSRAIHARSRNKPHPPRTELAIHRLLVRRCRSPEGS
jgi:hypothetical protein